MHIFMHYKNAMHMNPQNDINHLSDSDLLAIHKRVFENYLRRTIPREDHGTFVKLTHMHRDRITKENVRQIYFLKMESIKNALLQL